MEKSFVVLLIGVFAMIISAQKSPQVTDEEKFKPEATLHDEFDWLLTKKILSSDDHNSVISPFFVKILLSMLAEAAGQNTNVHRELSTILPSIRNIAEIRETNHAKIASLLKESSDYELNVGTKMYVDNFIQPRQRCAATIKSLYFSDVEPVDFQQPQETANAINVWCANITRNRITDIVTSDDIANSIVLLMNAIHFNGYWEKPFAEKDTVVHSFFTNVKLATQVPFMVRTDDFYYCASAELDARVLRIPYRGYKFAMYIILPNKLGDLDELISKIDSSTIQRTRSLLEKVVVKLSLPKFKFTSSVHLNEILKALGIRSIFTNQASFPQLVRGAAVRGRLQVSCVLQEIGIEVNEKENPASGSSLVNQFGGDIEFNANSPFVFLIEDETSGTLVFTGKVTRP